MARKAKGRNLIFWWTVYDKRRKRTTHKGEFFSDFFIIRCWRRVMDDGAKERDQGVILVNSTGLYDPATKLSRMRLGRTMEDLLYVDGGLVDGSKSSFLVIWSNQFCCEMQVNCDWQYWVRKIHIKSKRFFDGLNRWFVGFGLGQNVTRWLFLTGIKRE